ncbi:MAG: substrate-binding domain-containing protein [Burkholderiales bacterium]|nr:substrate-binding domain-containing protein [Burkholderiales bacterium]
MASVRSPRLADVARAAGVSLATASRALADPALVRERTRKGVLDAAAMLGYVPHGAARALATRRSRTIGAVFPPVDNPIFAGATHALAQQLAAAGYTLLLASHDYDYDAELAATRALIERGADGMVLVGLVHRPETLATLARAGIPYELTWSLDCTGRHHCVGLSHRSASIRITQHLLDLGHREVAVIAGDTAHNDRARERLDGVRDALAARGIRLPARRVVEVGFSVARGRAAFAALLERAPGFTAVIGGNDPLAIGALLECRARGIAVPDAMSIVGFDDIELAGELAPGLTTIRVPSAEIGREAGRRLLARLAGRSVPKVKTMPAPLIVRGTTGPPPHAGAKPAPARRRPAVV